MSQRSCLGLKACWRSPGSTWPWSATQKNKKQSKFELMLMQCVENFSQIRFFKNPSLDVHKMGHYLNALLMNIKSKSNYYKTKQPQYKSTFSPSCPSNWAVRLASCHQRDRQPLHQWRALSWYVQHSLWSWWGCHGELSRLCRWCVTRCPGHPPDGPGWGNVRSTWCASHGRLCKEWNGIKGI